MKKLLTVLSFISILILSCSKGDKLPDKLAQAEDLISSVPDYALALIKEKPYTAEDGDYLYASYCLLKTYAEYNTYSKDIDREQFSFATDYFIRHGNRERKALAYYLRAVVSQDMGEGSEAEHVHDLLLATKEIKRSKNHLLSALIYSRYGSELNARKWYESAIPIYEKSIEEAEKANARALLVTGYINLSHSQLFIGDADQNYDKAIETALKAVELSGDRDAEKSRALYALAACYSRDGQFDKSLECASTAVRIQERLVKEGKRKTPVTYNVLADAFRKNGCADSALFYAGKGLESQDKTIKLIATQLCYIVYRDLLGDTENSVKYMTMFNNLKQQNEQSLQNEKVMESRITVEKEEIRSSRARIIGTSAALLLLLCCVGFQVVRILRRNIRKKDIALRQKEKELGEVQPLLEKSESQRSELRSVIMDKDKLVVSLREKERYLDDSEWARLEKILNNVCDGFTDRLKSEFPEITPAELRLAILLRFHFTGKQMAAMIGISPTSVTKSKQRLRNRVSDRMKEGESIDDFISVY